LPLSCFACKRRLSRLFGLRARESGSIVKT
jgi:hypothetical protein